MKIMLIVLIITIAMVGCQLTIPLKIVHRNISSKVNHRSYNLHRVHSLQTYKLRPMEYFFSLDLKVAGIPYSLNIDTGSSDFFIKGENTPGIPADKYHCEDCINTQPHVRIGYLDGSMSTYEKQLEVQIGQHKFMESVLVAYQMHNKNFEDDEGIIGLSYQSLARNQKPNFISTLKNNKIVDKYAYGVNLNFKNKQHSFITFGTYDSSLFQGQLRLFPIQDRSSVTIKTKGVSFGEGELIKIDFGLMDTGNTCVSIPQSFQPQMLQAFQYTDIKNKVKSGNKCYFQVEQNIVMFSLLKCRVQNFDKLPDLNIHIGDSKFVISKEFYMQKCYLRKGEGQVRYCQSYIESFKGREEMIIGDTFFNRFYTYFDLEDHQVGIAKNKQTISIQTINSNHYIDDSKWRPVLNSHHPQSFLDYIQQLFVNIFS